MKIKTTLFISMLFFSIHSFSQQIGDGFAPMLPDFATPLNSGVYNGLNPIGGIPDNSYGGWQHLLVIRHPNPTNNHQLQIATSFSQNDRLFFRKIAGGLDPNNPAWVELATRGANNFIGDQNISGNVGIGTNQPIAKLTIKAGPDGYPTPLKAISILGPNSPENSNSAQDLSWDFAAAGSASIRSYRGGSWDTYLQFLTNSNIGGNAPQVRMHIDDSGNVGIGTTVPDEKLTVKGKIHTQEVRVDMAGPLVPDYVFANDYKLKTLQEVEAYIKQNSHLPEIPSAKEIEKNGLMLAEMNMALLKKMEEMTLYMIEQNKISQELTKKVELLETALKSTDFKNK